MFLSEDKIKEIGFKYVGKNVKISDKAVFYSPEKISIGDYSRIDDFCILSAGAGGIEIGKNVHISCYCSLTGAGKITFEDYSGASIRVTILSSTDDFTGNYATNATMDIELRNVFTAQVTIKEGAIIGCGSIIFPGVTIGESSSVGALSIVKKTILSNEVWAGIPAKFIKVKQ